MKQKDKIERKSFVSQQRKEMEMTTCLCKASGRRAWIVENDLREKNKKTGIAPGLYDY
ncbi:hypothetical protein G3A_08110 [Bacillus sp. 17376]|nr:hypothetical protein G3A_08110 [Bacillus sp. 17376]